MISYTPPGRPPVPASAVLRIGNHAPVPLHGTPAISPHYQPGEVTIALGYDSLGLAVTLTITRLEWADDLLNADLDAAACGVVRAGMTRTVTQ
jgi:hypothetical protein